MRSLHSRDHLSPSWLSSFHDHVHGALRREVPDDISECSRYSDPRALSLAQMVTMALDLDARTPAGQYL